MWALPDQKEELQVSRNMTKKKTVIIGATTNSDRYAYFAAQRLSQHGHPFVPVGIKKGEVLGEPILDLRQKPEISDVDTVTMFLNPANQKEWEEYILSLQPKRIVFNPGTENPEFAAKAQKEHIETLEACTLVMLGVGTY